MSKNQDLDILKIIGSDPLKQHREMMDALANPIKGMYGLTSSFQDPLQEHREMIEALANPMKDLHGLVSSFQDPLQEHREMMEALANPMKDLHGFTSSLHAPLIEHCEIMEALANPMKGLHALTSLLHDPLKEHREMMATLVDPMKELREMMEAIANPMKQFQATMANIIDPINLFQQSSSLTILKQMAEVELFTTAIRSTEISAATINEISSEIFVSSANSESDNLESLLNNILLEIKALKEPKLQQLIVSYIFPLILTMLTIILAPIADYHIKAYLQSDKRLRNKVVNQQVVSSVPDREILSTLRYVSADTLNVRSKPSVKSAILGYFHYGYVVHIIRKEKNWSLVEWTDQESGLQVTGWVNTRYLKRFR